VSTIYTFPNLTWIENLAVRQNGQVLCTALNRAALYQIDSFAHNATLVHQFDATDELTGIAEVKPDFFVLTSGNYNSTTSASAWPGSVKIWEINMADWTRASSQCRVYYA